MKQTKEQLKWEIQVLRRALQSCDSAYLERGSQYWIEQAGMELTRRNVREALEEDTGRKL